MTTSKIQQIQKQQKSDGKIIIIDYRKKPSKSKTLSFAFPKSMSVEDVRDKIAEALF